MDISTSICYKSSIIRLKRPKNEHLIEKIFGTASRRVTFWVTFKSFKYSKSFNRKFVRARVSLIFLFTLVSNKETVKLGRKANAGAVCPDVEKK